ncbi:MAG: ABC transporter ATP-binding protein [Peptococcaceae bacterium]|jgi:ABC-2 type transport system ATP-binding protein|nr:ABC transporter ATP-binding protein [Peptococcaceae bacterium]
MSSRAVVIQNMSYKYKQHAALRDFNLEVPPGIIHGLVGPASAGKTTFLNILAGTIKAAIGTGKVFNYRLGSKEARSIIGYVPARPAFYANLTVWEYLSYLGRLSGLSKRETAQRINLLLKEVDLYDFRDKIPSDFTPGMKTKIAIVQSFLHSPRLLLLDEPVTGLDETGKQSVLQIIRELSFMHGSTVIISAQNWRDIESITAAITFIDEGKVMLSAEIDEIRNLYSYGVFSLHTSDNETLLDILPRLAYLQHIIQTEDNSIMVMTKAKEQFRKDISEFINSIKAELYYFYEEEVNMGIVRRYLLPDREAE